MNNELQFGIQTNGIKHTHLDPMPNIDNRFSMVKEAKVLIKLQSKMKLSPF